MTRLAIIFSLLFVTPAWTKDYAFVENFGNKLCGQRIQFGLTNREAQLQSLISRIEKGDCDIIHVTSENHGGIIHGEHVYLIAKFCRFDRQIVVSPEESNEAFQMSSFQFSCVPKK